MLAMIGRIMIVSTTIAVKMPVPHGVRRPEERDEAERRVQRRLDVVAQERDEHEDPPEPDHDARNRGERLDERRHRARGSSAERARSGRARSRSRAASRGASAPTDGDGGAEEEGAGAEVMVDRVPADVRDEAEPERREREPRALDDLVDDQADEDGRAERGDARRRTCRRRSPKCDPPPREGAAGCVSGRVESAHVVRSDSLLRVDLLDLLLVERHDRTPESARRRASARTVWPCRDRPVDELLERGGVRRLFATTTYVYVQIGYAFVYFFDFGGLTIESEPSFAGSCRAAPRPAMRCRRRQHELAVPVLHR